MRKSELQSKYEEAIEKGLVSESAAERTQALRSAGDMLSPALGELAARAKAAEERLEFEKTSLKEVTAERDALAAKVAELQPLADKAVEVDALKATFDARVADARKELVLESQQRQFAAERADRQAADRLQEAQSRFGQAGLQLLLYEVQKLITSHSIVEPAPASLPAGISSMFLTLWGHSPLKAGLILAYAKSFPEPSENFRQQLLRILLAGSAYGIPSDPIENLGIKQEVLIAMAQRWNVLESVQREVDQVQVHRQGQVLLNNNLQLAAQQNDLAVRGYGRDPIRVEEKSITGCALSEHVEGCGCPLHTSGGRHATSIEEII